jgi:hypothetical protein
LTDVIVRGERMLIHNRETINVIFYALKASI